MKIFNLFHAFIYQKLHNVNHLTKLLLAQPSKKEWIKGGENFVDGFLISQIEAHWIIRNSIYIAAYHVIC